MRRRRPKSTARRRNGQRSHRRHAIVDARYTWHPDLEFCGVLWPPIRAVRPQNSRKYPLDAQAAQSSIPGASTILSLFSRCFVKRESTLCQRPSLQAADMQRDFDASHASISRRLLIAGLDRSKRPRLHGPKCVHTFEFGRKIDRGRVALGGSERDQARRDAKRKARPTTPMMMEVIR